MGKLLERFREWLKWRRIARAERAVWGYGYGVYHRGYVDEAYTRVVALQDYAARSGHLRRGFHAGKRVQRDTEAVVGMLYAASLLTSPRVARVGPYGREGPERVAGIVARVLAGILVGGTGPRAW